MADKKKPRGDKEPEKQPDDEARTLSIELHTPETLTSRYANHMLVQRGLDESFLLFFEIQPPVILGTPEEVEEQKKALESVQGTCIARIVVPNGLIPAIIKAFQQNLSR